MGGEINGETDAMREFVSRLTGSLKADPVSHIAQRGQDVPCAGGLPFCEDLTHEDNASTQLLHEFMTQVEQGFAAYSSFVQDTAAAYVHADETARNIFLAVLDTPHVDGLPPIDPRLER